MTREKIDEGVYLDKDKFGYKLVYPFKNEDGSLNWFNIAVGGNWYSLIKTIGFVLLIIFMSWSYAHDVKECREVMAAPCEACQAIGGFDSGDYWEDAINNLTEDDMKGWDWYDNISDFVE